MTWLRRIALTVSIAASLIWRTLVYIVTFGRVS